MRPVVTIDLRLRKSASPAQLGGRAETVCDSVGALAPRNVTVGMCRLFFGGVLCAALSITGCASRARVDQQALMLADTGQTQAALNLLEPYLVQHPAALRERQLAIRLYGVSGDLSKAESHALVLASALGPSSPLPWLELGHAQELSHHFDVALELYDRAAEVAPADPAGPRTGGMRAAEWGELEWAEPRLLEATRRAPSDARTWHALGLVRAHLRDFAGAELAYRSGVAVDARGLDNHVGLATLAVLRADADSALREYDIILGIEPRFADAELGRSWALIRLGRWVDAERTLARAGELGASASALAKQRTWLAQERAKSAGTR